MTRSKNDRTIQFKMMLSDGELAEIDDFQHENRISTRAEAVRRMMANGRESLTMSTTTSGATLSTAERRDRFAAAVLQGMLAGRHGEDLDERDYADWLVWAAKTLADKMVAALDRPTTQENPT